MNVSSKFSLKKHISEWKRTLLMMNAGWSRKPSVNCWFCDEDFCIESKADNSGWICPSCQQYNGFDEDGNYDRLISEQFEISKDDKTYCQRGNFVVKESILCRLCHQNQALKVGQLASFVPLTECHYDEEVDAYDRYLESVYRLCQCCRDRVRVYLTRQDEDILKKLDEKNLQITDIGLHDSELNDTKQAFGKSYSQSLMKRSFFSLCLLMAVINLINGNVYLELETTRIGLLLPSHVYTAIYYITSVIPFNGLSQLAVYFGTCFCLLGLLAVGKNSVYIVDALHILHWLALLIMNIISQPSSLSLPTAIICFIISLSTASVCFLCLTMPRRSRKIPKKASQVSNQSSSNTTQTALIEENLTSTDGKPVQSISPVLSTPRSSPLLYPVGEAKNFFKPISSGDSSPTIPFTSSSPISLFSQEKTKSTYEIVRDSLESFSLGLTKQTGSTSSIWSLPCTWSSDSTTSPDSTFSNTVDVTTATNHISQSVSRNILSPSRLSFVSFSHTPSPGKFSSSPSSDPDSEFSPDSSQHHYSHSLDISSSKSDQSSQKYGEENVPHSLLSQEKQSFTKYRSGSKCFTDKPHQFDNQLQSSLKEKNAPDSTSNENVGHQVRRSNRIAMRGKIIKPWPLKKSLSVNNMYDRLNDVDFYKKGNDRDYSVAHGGELQMASCGSSYITNTPYAAQRNHFMDKIAEISDDEDMESVKTERNHRKVMRGETEKDSKWTWTLLGVVIGISVTVNFFLGFNMWMYKNSPS